MGRPLRVATRFPNIANRHFLAHGRQVESGETLRENGLVEFEDVCRVSSVVVANRVGLKLERARIAPLLEALDRAS